MSYERFAAVYDTLMQDAPYDAWAKWVQKEASGGTLLDLGCGTGELAVRFAKTGFQVTGIDLSDSMLTIANQKAAQQQVSIPFFQQDMRNLEGIGFFQTIVILCDSLNYLETEEDMQQTFQSVFDHLEQGGLFLFDVHSQFKINEVFQAQTFADAGEEISFIWNAFPGEHSDSVEHELSFFVKEQSGMYKRFDELHCQRTFSPEQYTKWLEAAGFSVEAVTADFTNKAPVPQSERIFFKARKSS